MCACILEEAQSLGGPGLAQIDMGQPGMLLPWDLLGS